MTNREWLATLDDFQLSMFFTVGLPVHDTLYDFDVVVSIHGFLTPKAIRDWLKAKNKYKVGWTKKENDDDTF